ncbi:hypothetical protein ALC53_07234 [Atta colombica]|uniref:Uncharacterized protein n=1 Tax=Atta colombica TaxID=520822 RepID=A0A195BDE6_9HYME|nr:hypothetical protein ALC53_07234 [Atta colombica]
MIFCAACNCIFGGTIELNVPIKEIPILLHEHQHSPSFYQRMQDHRLRQENCRRYLTTFWILYEKSEQISREMYTLIACYRTPLRFIFLRGSEGGCAPHSFLSTKRTEVTITPEN